MAEYLAKDTIDTVLFVSGFAWAAPRKALFDERTRAREVRREEDKLAFETTRSTALRHWKRVIEVDPSALYLNRNYVNGPEFKMSEFPMPCGIEGKIARGLDKADRNCTTIKFYVWTLLEYDGVLFLDSSMSILENPVPFMHAACKSGHPFASDTTASKPNDPFTGLGTHLMWIVPDLFTFEILMHKAITGDSLRLTGDERDVVQAVFAPMAMDTILRDINYSNVEGGKLPLFRHGK